MSSGHGLNTKIIVLAILVGLPLASVSIFLGARQLLFLWAPDFYVKNLMRIMGDIRPRDKEYWEEYNKQNSLDQNEYKKLGLEVPDSYSAQVKDGSRFCSALGTEDCLIRRSAHWEWESGAKVNRVSMSSMNVVTTGNQYYCQIGAQNSHRAPMKCTRDGWVAIQGAPKPLAQKDFQESYELSKSAGGLSRSSRCPSNFVSIGQGYCQQVICKLTQQVVGKKEIWKGPTSAPGIEHFGGNYYYEDVTIPTGAENDPRLVKLGFYCSSDRRIMLSPKIVEEK